MNDFSSVGIAALLLALLPLMQTCFRMVRLQCGPANGARGDRQRRDAVSTAVAALSARRRRTFQNSSQISGRARQAPHFDLRADFFRQLGPVHTRGDRWPRPGPAAIALRQEGTHQKSKNPKTLKALGVSPKFQKIKNQIPD
jgi:hypothetical protein